MSSLPPDPWQVLGIAKTADKTEIRTAYRKLVLKCHPDKVQDPTLKAEKQDEFQKVQQAYELLNNDEERAKYEHQVRMSELNQQKARAASKSAAHSPAARSSPRHKEFAFSSTPERATHRTTTSTREKMYFQPSRSHEEVPTARFADMNFNEERRARRATSYEKQPRPEDERPSRREEEKAPRREDERPARREEEKPVRREEEKSKDKRKDEEEKKARRQRDLARELEEMADSGRKAEKKKTDRERERPEKERKSEDKSRRHKGPSIEVMEEPEEPPKSDKKSAKSSSKKYTETKERERDGSRSREYDYGREKSASRPAAGFVADDPLEKAKLYIQNRGTKVRDGERMPKLGRSQTDFWSYKPEVPRPSPADYDEEEVPRSSARPRRCSHETPARSKEGPNIIPVSPRLAPTNSRPNPINVKASKTHAVPSPLNSPSRMQRSATTNDIHSGHQFHPPPMTRHTTWAPSSDRHFDKVYHNDSDDDYGRHHRSRYADSPSDGVRYKADGGRSSRRDEPTYPQAYSRGTSATRAPPEMYGSARMYSTSGMKVKEGKTFTTTDVKYADIPYPHRAYPSVPSY
ncbi:hypothetical protein NEUTE1DRAFT_75440 [Neurospora tetrasperma FGSC 2508]|uniref:J domain-containing protein n=1 Tax=Neurospora tetrasperma (strain FGSC 2508 / ATCC MYA-4615 / P0657) TaxID=510951 RepID=F8MC55_NEUT8|nr:uncharacterized protein NEUTE1DRAFT_75440 [Neurospora tetrasperma FGSC 2508]EGO60409.1 hypothetical protein NEUTE1DRAFT_75440 [Neurospora tetrasperma FGSC 2508]EGZ75614.1 DnaJ-domain-containing protein [Neurospora tetrasperma FGSC 2509]